MNSDFAGAGEKLTGAQRRKASLRRPNWRVRAFDLVAKGCLLFVLLTALAMLFYRGGTALDPHRAGYSFFENFFSELGLTVARSGESNTISAILFFVALFASGAALALFFVAAPGLFRHSRWGRLLSGTGSAFGLLAGTGFMGVAFTPADLFIDGHIFFVLWAFRLFPLAVLPYVPAILSHPRYPNRYAVLFLAFFALLFAYLLLLTQGPNPESASGRQIQVVGQKLIGYASVISIYLQSRAAGTLLKA
jgi:hypothetical protein